MVEMVAKFPLPRPLGVINNGPNNVELVRYRSDICSETRTIIILLSCCISAFVRLVISSLSHPTSSSSSSAPRPAHPSLSSSSSSSSSSSVSDPLRPSLYRSMQSKCCTLWRWLGGTTQAVLLTGRAILSRSSPHRRLTG